MPWHDFKICHGNKCISLISFHHAYKLFLLLIQCIVVALFLSLLPVLPWCLRHLRPVWQTLGPYIDVFLQRPAHLPHHAQLSHWGRESVHPAASAIHPRCPAVPPRPLRLEQVCLPVWYWPGWVIEMDRFVFVFKAYIYVGDVSYLTQII